jgi:hypothetical protein
MSAALRSTACGLPAARSGRVVLPRRNAFAGKNIALKKVKFVQRLQGAPVQAFLREYPDPDFIAGASYHLCIKAQRGLCMHFLDCLH